jgi:hypothetical protein
VQEALGAAERDRADLRLVRKLFEGIAEQLIRDRRRIEEPVELRSSELSSSVPDRKHGDSDPGDQPK